MTRVHELLDLDVASAGRALRERNVAAVDLCSAYLERIQDTEPQLNAYLTVDADGAIAAAAEADRELAAGSDRGPLHGIPVGVKDLIDTAALRTTYGSSQYRDHVPDLDAIIVQRLREAGAVILGKHATHEFAWGGRTDSAFFGPTRNPWDTARIPGGSSGGGGASVAARSCLIAVGTDTAGSVRIPAALCGCVGFKPTQGWMPMKGVFPLAPALDHVGLLGQTVSDVSLAYGALAGPVAGGTSCDPRGKRIGVLSGDHVMSDASGAAVDVARGAFVAAGSDVEVVHDVDLTARTEAALTLVLAAAERIHRSAFETSPDRFGADLAELLSMGPVSALREADAQEVLRVEAQRLDRLLGSFDVVIGAAVPVTAPLIGEMVQAWGSQEVPIEFILTRLTSIADVVGVPAVTVPVSTAGMPVGVQLMSERTNDGDLLSAARWLESACGQRRDWSSVDVGPQQLGTGVLFKPGASRVGRQLRH